MTPWPQSRCSVIGTGIVHFADLQSRLVDSKAQVIQSHVTTPYTSGNVGDKRKDQWFLNAKFVPGLGLDAVYRL